MEHHAIHGGYYTSHILRAWTTILLAEDMRPIISSAYGTPCYPRRILHLAYPPRIHYHSIRGGYETHHILCVWNTMLSTEDITPRISSANTLPCYSRRI